MPPRYDSMVRCAMCDVHRLRSLKLFGSLLFSSVLQLRRLPGDRAPPVKVECNGKVLPHIKPPTTEGALLELGGAAGATAGVGTGTAAAGGWWVVGDAEDSLWIAGGSLMVALPVSTDVLNVVLNYSTLV